MLKNLFNIENAKFIEVAADVRYWDDAHVNNKQDTDGTLIPFRNGETWEPIIDLETGKFLNWPEGNRAQIHYKICDAGEYWLLDANQQRIAKWKGHYVPNGILCVGSNGYGDYIILNVEANGVIVGWKKPDLDPEQWNSV